MDMTSTVVPKSDQTNADDLIAGPRTIRITKVSGTGQPDQPVAVYFDGDDGRPFKPCKTMRRLMMGGWGTDAAQYAGRRMTIYRDPKVAFGGMEVGGIRISHMSDIEADMKLALTVTKAKRAMFTVMPLPAEKPKAHDVEAGARDLVARIEAVPEMMELMALTADADVVKKRTYLAKNRPELANAVNDAVEAKRAAFDVPSAAADDDTVPGDRP